MNTPPNTYKLHTDTDFAQGVKSLFEKLDKQLQLTFPVTAYVAGGVAVHFYTAHRVSNDIDAEFSHRVLIPDNLYAQVPSPDGPPRLVYFDRQYNVMFALTHEDYQRDSVEVPLGVEHFNVRILSPVDLAISKIARFEEHDKQDIAELVANGLTNAAEIEKRALDALPFFVGHKRWLELNLQDTIKLALVVEAKLLGYGNTNFVTAESGKTYGGFILDVLQDEAIQATENGLVRHPRQHLRDRGLLARGHNLQISYPSGPVGIVRQANETEHSAGKGYQRPGRENGF